MYFPIFSISYISRRGLIELRLESHLSHLSRIIVMLQKVRNYCVELHLSKHTFLSALEISLPPSPLSLNFLLNIFFISAHLYLLLISFRYPHYPQLIQPDPLFPWFFFLSSHYLSSLVAHTHICIDPYLLLHHHSPSVPHSDPFSLFLREMMERSDPGDFLVNQWVITCIII